MCGIRSASDPATNTSMPLRPPRARMMGKRNARHVEKIAYSRSLRLFCCSLLAVFMLAAAPPPRPQQMLGVASLCSGRPCLAIRNSSLRPGRLLQIAGTLDPQDPQARQFSFTARVGARRAPPEGDLNFYDVAIDGVPMLPAIAIVGFRGKIQRAGDSLWADLYGDGQRAFFRSCASFEGIHFTVWTGRPLSGTLLWHQYFYLGYDVEPTCTAAEMPDPSH